MGVLGLASFINNSCVDYVVDDLKLHNCRLLIDGNSFLHKVHQIHQIQAAYGGNYDQLTACLYELFAIFEKCKIEPIVLLDGGQDKSGRKFQTTLNRAYKRLHDVNTVASQTTTSLDSLIETGHYRLVNNLLPIMAFKVFYDVLLKLGIVYFHCDFEADYELVCLANELKCPILSCDSDFFMYDLKNGYISTDFFEMNVKKLRRHFINEDITAAPDDEDSDDSDTELPDQKYYLPVKVYNIEKFKRHFGQIKSDVLPLFAMLCGNDYVDRSILSSFLDTFKTDNNNLRKTKHHRKQSSVSYAKKKENHYRKILKWLCQFKNADDCLATLLNFVKKEKHDQVRNAAAEMVNEYMCLKPSSCSMYKREVLSHSDKFNGATEMDTDCCLRPQKELTSFSGSVLNAAFLEAYHRCRLSRFVLDILIHRRVLFGCQIEVSNWPSTYMSSMAIRKCCYFFLLNEFESRNSDTDYAINEYLRYQKEIKVFNIDLKDLDLDFTKIATNIYGYIYKDLFLLSDSMREQLCKNSSDKCLTLFFSMIYFWATNNCADRQFQEFTAVKNRNCVRAFIVSLIRSSIINPCLSTYDKKESDCDGLSCSSEREHLIQDFFSFDSTEFASDLNNRIKSVPTNFDYMKELHIKLSKFCPTAFSLTNQMVNVNQTNSAVTGKTNRVFNLKLIHSLCEFQAIYLSMNFLNEFLTFKSVPLRLLSLNHFSNGTFLHNFIMELERRPHPDLYIEEMFGRRSLLKSLYNEFINLFDVLFVNENPIKINDNRISLIK